MESFFFSTTGFWIGLSLWMTSIIADSTISRKSLCSIYRSNRLLYAKGQLANALNLLGIGPILYGGIRSTVLTETGNFSPYELNPTHLALILALQNIGYFVSHKCFHLSPKFYRFHKFHHKFDKILIPSLGNAVSPTEFIVAYMTPFAVGSLATFPTEITFAAALYIVGLLNMVIHCQELNSVNYPKFIVSPKKHSKHHLIRKKHYAAPFIDIDAVLENN